MIHYADTRRKAVALTFDDGPDPVYTPQVLEILNQYQVTATFYTIGECLDLYPDIAKAAHDAGHEIGNHTMTHPYLTELTIEEVRNQLAMTEERIAKLTGEKPVSFRPPYLASNEIVTEAARAFGYAVIGAANPDAQDWASPGVDHIASKTLEASREGAMILLHDSSGDRSQTVEALHRIIPGLRDRGYEIVSVKQLLYADRD